jgi:hypothetical protein
VSEEKFLTTADIPAFLRDNRGIKVGRSTIEKWVSPSINRGPRPAAYWSRRPLFKPSDVLAWADARLRRPSTSTTEA